jgi:predicted RNA-binding protein with RPS1 domain
MLNNTLSTTLMLTHSAIERNSCTRMQRRVRNKISLALTFLLSTTAIVACARTHAFVVVPSPTPKRIVSPQHSVLALSTDTSLDRNLDASEKQSPPIRPCYYKTPEGRWKPRIELSALALGQELQGYVVQELLDGVTGPKVFLEVGVGRTTRQRVFNETDVVSAARPESGWKIVYAMLRLGSKGTKPSVTQKRAARLRKKTAGTPVFVSKIRSENGQLEVCLNEFDVERSATPKVSASSFPIGKELTGTIKRIEPYGVMIDVGANRLGLLHIRKVADLYGSFIDKAQGLEEAGLELNTKVKVQVASNEGKRLFLDFTNDVKEEGRLEREEREREKQERYERWLARNQLMAVPGENETTSVAVPSDTFSVEEDVDSNVSTTISDEESLLSEEEAAAWAVFATGGSTSVSVPSVVEEEDEDDYDEDRDIEDALGLGTY